MTTDLLILNSFYFVIISALINSLMYLEMRIIRPIPRRLSISITLRLLWLMQLESSIA